MPLISRTDARGGLLLIALLVCSPAFAQPAATPAPPGLGPAEIREFLLNARITRSRDISKGVTAPKRLTLTNGTMTHDAAFQAVDSGRRSPA